MLSIGEVDHMLPTSIFPNETSMLDKLHLKTLIL